MGRTQVRRNVAKAATQFLREYEIITEGQRNAQYVQGHGRRLRKYLLPFFGEMLLSDITPGIVQEHRIDRREKAIEENGKPPARSTMHQEIVVLRQVLKTANRHGWLPLLPDLAEPYKASGKISHRAWFSPEEYKKLYEATRRRRKNRSGTATSGKAPSFMTMSSSWRIRGFGLTRPPVLNIAMSASSMTMQPAKQFLRSKFVENAVWDTAKARRGQ